MSRTMRLPTVVALCLSCAPAFAAPIERLEQIAPAIMSCWHPPERTGGMAVTARFSLKRDGSLLGPPKFLGAVSSSDEQINRAFQASVDEVFARCVPVQLTPGLGGAVAGQVFTLRFAVGIAQ